MTAAWDRDEALRVAEAMEKKRVTFHYKVLRPVCVKNAERTFMEASW